MTGVLVRIIGGLVLLLGLNQTAFSQPRYPWLDHSENSARTVAHIKLPPNTLRPAADSDSFATWLRNLPLLPDTTPVRLYDGDLKGNQSAHAAIIDIDIGRRDLQQCADAAIRLRAEYLYSNSKDEEITFRFTSGDTASWQKWAEGFRPKVNGNNVTWCRESAADSSYQNFREYLDSVFMYAGTISLNRDLDHKADLCSTEPGDILLRGGSPGHAVIVLDIAIDTTTDQKYFLLAQSFMPAQNIHVLRNPSNFDLSPWYSCECSDQVVTPEWTFRCTDLRSF